MSSDRAAGGPGKSGAWHVGAGALVFGVVIASWRWETLTLPPWQDQAVGLWAEADYLVESGFDYWSLRYDVPHYLDVPSGPRSYMISVLPTLVAIIMSVAPSPWHTTVIVHAASFFCGGLLLALAFSAWRTRVGDVAALALCAALATTPVWITQVELAGMDVPLGVCTLLALVWLSRGNYLAAAVASAAAFACKASGQLVVMAGLAYLTISLFLGGEQEPGARRRQLLGLAAHGSVFVLSMVLVRWGDTTWSQRFSTAWPDALRLRYAMWTTTPDIICLLVLGSLVLLAALVRGATRTMRDGGGISVIVEQARRAWRDDPLRAVSFLMVAGFFASHSFYIYIPRYVFAVLPAIYCLTLPRRLASRASRLGLTLAACGLCTFNLANSAGTLFPKLPPSDAVDYSYAPSFTPRSCMLLERSREYLSEHRANMQTVAWLSAHGADRPILVENPFLFLLTRPRLGYVSHPFEAYDAGVFALALDSYCRLAQHPPSRRPLLVWYGESRVTLPPPNDDEVIYSDHLDPPLVVYCKDPPAEVLVEPRALEDWYLDATWGPAWVNDRLRQRLPFLYSTDRGQRAMDEAAQAIHWDPRDPDLVQLQREIADEVQRRTP
ncbi:MAG: hypothetical protein K2Y37_09385 [Pirellulales bacterium]|nr:hypothetical protein [Pirellulales bacterium]